MSDTTMKAAPMTTPQVREVLALRWPDSEYLVIPEAPQDAARMGRKIDLLVLSLWQSRGFERHAVEIKVSYSDWTRERQEASKADFWWRHSHRFWLAAPAALVMRIKPELPIGWGLLSCEVGACPKVIVKPPRHDAEPLPEATCIGIMRASADAGVNALRRAEARGRQDGIKEGRRIAERDSGDGVAREELERLRRQVREFEEHAGMTISDRWGDVAELGRMAGIVKREIGDPGWVVKMIGGAAKRAIDDAANVHAQAKKLAESCDSLANALAEAREEAAYV